MLTRFPLALLLRAALYLAIAALIVSAGASSATTRLLAKPPPERSASLMFVGDIMLSRAIGRIMEEYDDWAYPFRDVREVTRAADLAIGNLEGPISNRGRNQGSIYSFLADPRAVAGLADAGFDVLTIANNHIWDYGPDAMRDTFSHLSASGIAAVGGGEDFISVHEPVLRTINGIHIAFLGYTNLIPRSRDAIDASPAIAYLDPAVAAADVARAKNEADVVVVLLHWGNEYETRASPAQRDIAHALIDAGAALVIGHHPHVVQEVEQYDRGLIAYSLGNFVFDQNFSKDTRRGLGLR